MGDYRKNIYFYGRSSKGRCDPKYEFCSNFHISPFAINDKEYMTVEHYFQSKKHEGTELEEIIRLASTPKEAKELAWSQQISDIAAWERKKDDIMMTAIRAKFSQNPELKKKLLASGDKKLHEDSPSDLYWGIKGQDKLGKILMLVREELKSTENSKKDEDDY